MDTFFLIYFIVLCCFVFSYAVVFFILFIARKYYRQRTKEDIELSTPEDFSVDLQLVAAKEKAE